MSRNGELCCTRIIFSYSPTAGYPGLRQFFATQLPALKAKYPSVVIDVRPRQWAETSITGVFKDGSERAYNIHELSSMGIWIRCHKLISQGNDYDFPFHSGTVHLNRKSVQGVWNPWLWHAEARNKSRVEEKQWDRKLSSKEWDYYVTKYSSEMKLEEQAIQDLIAAKTELPKEHTQELARRWKDHVAPKLQTDMEHNLSKFKQDFKKGVKPAPVAFNEYKLFSVPNVQELGQQAVDSLRRKEVAALDKWWSQRKEQLRPPA